MKRAKKSHRSANHRRWDTASQPAVDTLPTLFLQGPNTPCFQRVAECGIWSQKKVALGLNQCLNVWQHQGSWLQNKADATTLFIISIIRYLLSTWLHARLCLLSAPEVMSRLIPKTLGSGHCLLHFTDGAAHSSFQRENLNEIICKTHAVSGTEWGFKRKMRHFNCI